MSGVEVDREAAATGTGGARTGAPGTGKGQGKGKGKGNGGKEKHGREGNYFSPFAPVRLTFSCWASEAPT